MTDLLSEVIKTRRVDRGLTLQEVSHDAQIDESTISRIEKGQTQGSLLSVVAICQTLKISPRDLFPNLDQGRLRLHVHNSPLVLSTDSTVMRNDVELFLRTFFTHPWLVRKLLAKLINQISAQALNKTFMDDDPELPRFVATDIDRFSSSDAMFAFEIREPYLPGFKLHAIYVANGAFTFKDARNYASNTLIEYDIEVGFQLANLISRLNVTTIERIKFSDVIQLQLGLIDFDDYLSMFWLAAQFHLWMDRYIAKLTANYEGNDITPTPALGYLFLTVCRWFFRYNKNNNWLDSIRNDLFSIDSNTK